MLVAFRQASDCHGFVPPPLVLCHANEAATSVCCDASRGLWLFVAFTAGSGVDSLRHSVLQPTLEGVGESVVRNSMAHAIVSGLLMVVVLVRPSAASGERLDIDSLADLPLEELLEMEVTSTTLTAQPIAQAPSVVTLLTQRHFRALELRTLAEALQLVEGISVLPGKFGTASIAIRGTVSDANVFVGLDGLRLNDHYDGYFPRDIGLQHIQRLEVVRGPGSAIYGTNAFSAVISMFSDATRDSSDLGVQTETLVDDEIGHGFRIFGHHHQALGERWRVRVSGQYRDTTGAKVRVENDLSTGLDYSQLPGVTHDERRFLQAQAVVAGTQLLLPDDEVALTLSSYHVRHGPYFGPQKVFTADGHQQRTGLLARLAYDAPIGRSWDLSLAASHCVVHRDDLIQEQPVGFVDDVDGDFQVDPGETFPDGKLRSLSYWSNRMASHARLTHKWRREAPFIKRNRVMAGVEMEYDWLPALDYGQNFESGRYRPGGLRNWDAVDLAQRGQSRLVVAALLQDELQLLDNLWLTVGARYDWYSDVGQTFNPRAALVWRPFALLYVKLLYARAFRAPTFRELYDSTSIEEFRFRIAGNPDLEPETTDTVELAVDWDIFGFAGLRANLFYTQTDHTIEWDSSFNVAGAPFVNFPGRRIYGGEAALHVEVGPRVRLTGNVSLFRSDQLGEGLPGWEETLHRRFGVKELTDIPRIRANGILLADLPRSMTLGVRYSFVGPSESNKRSIWERLGRGFERRAFHELAFNLIVPLLGGKVQANAGVVTAFGKAIPVSLVNEIYQLPAPSLGIRTGLRASF
jgi:outer membrane receptor for ferrienterochelin and colicins